VPVVKPDFLAFSVITISLTLRHVFVFVCLRVCLCLFTCLSLFVYVFVFVCLRVCVTCLMCVVYLGHVSVHVGLGNRALSLCVQGNARVNI
jgi:hypothetical protein